MSRPAHVFVCYSALSLDAACRIANELDSKELSQTHFLVMFAGDISRCPKNTKVTVMTPPPHAYSEWGKPFAIANWFSKWQKANRNLRQVTAYIPHPFELPGNHFFFGSKETSRLEMLPDGLINYYQHSLQPDSFGKSVRLKVRQALRVLAAKRVGLQYTPLKDGHITQYEQNRHSRTWTENPAGLLTKSGEVRALPPRFPYGDGRTLGKSTRPKTLVVDQELDSVLSPELELEVRSALVAELKRMGERSILYKAHPRGLNRCQSLREQGLQLTDVSGPELAEEFVVTNDVTTLVGFYSTPLVLSGRDVKDRRSLLPDPGRRGVRRQRRVALIREALVRAGVQMISSQRQGMGLAIESMNPR